MSDNSPQMFIETYLQEMLIMQLATVANDIPWICTLHYIADKKAHIYWISKNDRRHSMEITNNPNVSIAIAVHTEKPLVGLQAEGTAEIINDEPEIRKIMEQYIEKHGTDRTFAESIIDGTNEHKLYKFTPKSFYLFDQRNFAGQPTQVWKPDNT